MAPTATATAANPSKAKTFQSNGSGNPGSLKPHANQTDQTIHIASLQSNLYAPPITRCYKGSRSHPDPCNLYTET